MVLNVDHTLLIWSCNSKAIRRNVAVEVLLWLQYSYSMTGCHCSQGTLTAASKSSAARAGLHMAG